MNDDRFRLITTGKLSPEGDKDRIYQYFIKTKGLSASNAQSFFFGSPVTLAKNLNWENAEAIKNNFYILTSLPTYAYNLTAHARLLVWSTLILMQKLYNYYIEITQMIRFSKMDFRKRDPSEHMHKFGRTHLPLPHPRTHIAAIQVRIFSYQTIKLVINCGRYLRIIQRELPDRCFHPGQQKL